MNRILGVNPLPGSNQSSFALSRLLKFHVMLSCWGKGDFHCLKMFLKRVCREHCAKKNPLNLCS